MSARLPPEPALFHKRGTWHRGRTWAPQVSGLGECLKAVLPLKWEPQTCERSPCTMEGYSSFAGALKTNMHHSDLMGSQQKLQKCCFQPVLCAGSHRKRFCPVTAHLDEGLCVPVATSGESIRTRRSLVTRQPHSQLNKGYQTQNKGGSYNGSTPKAA